VGGRGAGSAEAAVLVGWSLGGIFARELAKPRPELVRLVVTLGSPFSGDPRANNAWRIYELLNDHPVDRPLIASDLAEKPPVPTVAVWSPRDGIVAPVAARRQRHESDRQVQLNERHLSLARAPGGIQLVGNILREELG